MPANQRKKSSGKSDPLPKNSKWYKYLAKICNNDIQASRNEYYLPAPEFLTNLLGIEEKDRPLWYCHFNVGVSILVTILLVPLLAQLPWYYTALLTVFRFAAIGLPRFILGLHFAAHAPIIKPAFLNKIYIEYFCAMFYGVPPGMYRFHHIIMHHKEDNIHPLDLSSTMPYQRDNFLHFLYYWARFEFGIWVELPYYLFKKGYYSMLFLEGVPMLAFWWIMNYYIWVNISPIISLWIFLIPQFIVSFLFMFGNFSQHMFVNPEQYEDDHQLTINLINTPYNQLTFNDGYHIIHHKYPTLHWKELPTRFIQDRELMKHQDANAINFKEIDYFWMGIYVFTGQLKTLAKYFVPISEKQSNYSVDQIIEMFKSRFVPIPRP